MSPSRLADAARSWCLHFDRHRLSVVCSGQHRVRHLCSVSRTHSVPERRRCRIFRDLSTADRCGVTAGPLTSRWQTGRSVAGRPGRCPRGRLGWLVARAAHYVGKSLRRLRGVGGRHGLSARGSDGGIDDRRSAHVAWPSTRPTVGCAGGLPDDLRLCRHHLPPQIEQ